MLQTRSDVDFAREEAYLPSGKAWFLVGALALASMVAYVDRQVLVLLFEPIKGDLRLTDTEVSLLVGLAFVLCYSVFGLVSGWLADRRSRKGLISIGIVVWSAATALCGMANSFGGLFAARALVGVGESALSPAALSSITDAFPRDKLARAMSVYTAAAFLGMGLAMMLGGIGIAVATGIIESGTPWVGDLKPWQLAFVLIGALGGLVVIPVAFTREPPRARSASAAEEGAGQAAGPALGKFLKANKGSFGFLWLGFSLSAMSGIATLSWTPTYFIRVHGMTAPQIGLAYGAMVAVFGLIGVLAGPWLFGIAKRRGMRDGYVVFPLVCFTLGAITTILIFSVGDRTTALSLIAIKQLVLAAPMPIMAMSMQIIAPPELRGRLSAIYLFMGNIVAAAVGPVTVALMTDYLFADESQVGLSVITNTAVLIPLAALCLWLAIKPYRESLRDADAGFVRTY